MGSHYADLEFKLIRALESRGILISTETRSFMGRENTLVKLHVLKCITQNMETGEWEYEEMFKSSSIMFCMLYLRDMWYVLNGWELPTGDPKWDFRRKVLIEKGDPRYGSNREWYTKAVERIQNSRA